MKNPLRGLIAAPFTPLQPNGALAPEAVPLLAQSLARNGVSGAFICGTTGEGCSLSHAERLRVAETWRAAAPAGLSVIVHVGHLCLEESREFARHAQAIGADAIATIAPSFFKPAGTSELVAWCAAVAAAAPELPFYYYHMPSMTGVTIPATEFLRAAHGQIPTLAGVKFTFEDLEDYSAAREFADGRYTVLFGRDEILLSALKRGAPGAVGSTYNYAAPLFRRVMAAVEAGEAATAAELQRQARAFIDVMFRHGGLAAGKAIMDLIGLDCGPVRLPLRELTPEQKSALRTDLSTIGFFEYCSKAT